MPFHNEFLFSTYYLQKKLPRTALWDVPVGGAYSRARRLWEEIEEYGPENLSEAQVEEIFIRPLLKDVLGWHFLPQAKTRIQGRKRLPDYALFTTDNARKEAVKLQKQDVIRGISLAKAIAEAKAWDVSLDRRSREEATPHFQMIHYLTWLPVRYGILTNGRVWRLYVKGANVGPKTYYEVYLDEALRDEESFKYFYLFFRRDAFVEIAGKPAFIDFVKDESDLYAVALERDLRGVIYDRWLEETAKAIYEELPQSNPEDIYEATLLLLFRLLFVGYAEARGILPAREGEPYYRYSLTAILKEITDPSYVPLELSRNLYERVKLLFNIVDKGSKKLNVPPYNGGLFSQREGIGDAFTRGREVLERVTLKDPQMAKILKALFVRDGELVDFSTLDTRRLGSIYEGTTEYVLKVADEPMVLVRTPEGREFIIAESLAGSNLKIIKRYEKGEIYIVRHDGSRKSTGTYYTPDPFVRYLVKRTVDEALKPLIDEIERLNSEASRLPDMKELYEERAREVLFSLKVLDPAMGSGHFLVETAHYLTERLMDVAAKYEVSGIYNAINDLKNQIGTNADDASLLRRLVAKKCVFGIDLNPFAVELAKLSLWLDTTVPGAPLSYLSHHLRVGNSLVGYDLDAFLGELKEAIKSDLFMNKLRNKLHELAERMERVKDLRDSTVDEVYESEREFLAFLRDVEPIRFLMDLYTASHYPGYEDVKKYLKRGDMVQDVLFLGVEHAPDELKRRIEDFRNELKPFHWKLEFPEAWSSKGFDVVIGNPPWDKVKPEEPAFFSRFDPDYRKYNKDRKKAIRTKVLSYAEYRKEWENYRRTILNFGKYIKDNYRFYADKGDVNLYRVFMERAFQMLKDGGIFGFVVPGSFYQEDGSASLRRFLVEENTLKEVLGFENRLDKGGRFFNDVTSQFKIALVIAKKGGKTQEPIKTFFLSRNPEDLDRPESRMAYPIPLLKRLSPEKFAFLELRSQMDVQIVQKCYDLYPPLRDKSHPWKIDFTNDLHMTNDNHLFHEEGGDLPLYEGKMIWQFRHDWATPRYWLKIEELKRLKRRDGTPRFQLPDGSWRWEHYRVGFRLVASNTNVRTLIISIIPKTLAGNSIYVEKVYPKISAWQRLYTVGIFNSFLIDYIVRFMVQTNVNLPYLYRLPFPSLSENDPRLQRIALLSARLVGYTEEFADLMSSLGLDWKEDGIPPLCPKHRKEALESGRMEDYLLPEKCEECRRLQMERIKLRAEIDVIVARDIFHLTREEYEHVLKSVRAGKDRPSPLRTYMETLKEEIRRRW